MNEVKMAIQEPVCECVNCDNSQSSSNKTTKSKSKKTQKNKEISLVACHTCIVFYLHGNILRSGTNPQRRDHPFHYRLRD